MNHRHLLPNEIDLLVDGEAGFGVAPLRAHLDECPECMTTYRDGRALVDLLGDLPHFTPDSRLADRVMVQVPVFVPVHVAARDSVARWMPRAGMARAAALGVVGSVAGLMTIAIVWLALQGSSVVFIASLVGDRARVAIGEGARVVLASLLGETAVSALQASGTAGLLVLLAGVLLAGTGTVLGIRRLAAVERR